MPQCLGMSSTANELLSRDVLVVLLSIPHAAVRMFCNVPALAHAPGPWLGQGQPPNCVLR